MAIGNVTPSLNGDNIDTLIENQIEVMVTLQNLIAQYGKTIPHMRNYISDPTGYEIDREKHRERMISLQTMLEGLEDEIYNFK